MADEALTQVGLIDRADQPAGSLNVAQKKRLEMARALAAQPYLLLLDEVLAGLNPSEIAAMMETVRAIRDQGVTILMIEHVMQAIMSHLRPDPGPGLRHADRHGPPRRSGQQSPGDRGLPGRSENDGATAGGVDAMAILEVNDITSGYEGVQILWGVNLKLETGQTHHPGGLQRRGQDHPAQNRDGADAAPGRVR